MKTEFNDPNDPDDAPFAAFHARTIGETKVDQIVRIQPYPLVKRLELGGIFGNRYITVETGREIADEINRACDFIENGGEA